MGKKTKFGLAAGAGFVGGAAAGIAGMEVYHRYKQYKAMMHYKVIGYIQKYCTEYKTLLSSTKIQNIKQHCFYIADT